MPLSSVRVTEEMIAALDELAAVMSARIAGLPVTRSDVLRASVERGIAVLRAELGITAPPAAPAKEKGKKGGPPK